jgi:Ni/Fe-hydrogenase 1 B-type cytochrome subunit
MHVERDIGDSRLGGRAFYVYEAPVRLWHWLNAGCIVVLAATGYYIGNPLLPTLPGEAIEHFSLGYVRFVHFATAHVFAAALVARLYWAVVGNRHAHQIFVLPLVDRTWWADVLHQARWYVFLERMPKRYLGHNPLAQLGMVFGFTLPALFMVVTGFALYSEGQGQGTLHDQLFGWVIPLLGQSQAVHTWHHLGMWVIVCFVLVHVYIAFREELMSRQSILASMSSGIRTFRD